ncbi:DUF7146 domain-containing protein [Teichococcus vastitatis]|uniref:DUF7146 domain-containing protein n=1 Tax=Teichococcus vastitatis TaxID=2307076 RepID=UPI000E73DDCC|nr:toprim domain-containing protein [Pseudoroseomonas vastitatis]
MRLGRRWRWGRKGAFSVTVRGAGRGHWRNFDGDDHGDMLALIMQERGGDFSQAVEWARGFLGTGPRIAHTIRQRQATVSVIDEDAARIEQARRYWNQGKPPIGTPADLYLTDTRKIPRPASGWPSCVRYHPGRNALMVAATLADGTVQAVQLIHLTPDGKKRPQEEGRPIKQSFGPQAGAAVRLSGASGPLLLAEGPETALSLWAATGRETWVGLGGVGKLPVPDFRVIVVCADDDPKDAPGSKALQKTISRWQGEGREIAIARPWPNRRYNKSDFNDLLQQNGSAAVLARVEIALQPRGPQPPAGKALPLPLARHRLGQAVTSFFERAAEYDPDVQDNAAPIVWGAKVSVGVGKSHLSRIGAARFLADLRARGDRRTIIMAVPTHKLGEEQAAAFMALPEARAAGLTAGVWRGREAPDPQQPGQAMCHDLDAVREVQSLGLNIEKSLCRHKPRGMPAVECPFHGACGYQLQKQAIADFWLVPHESLFHEKPKAVGIPAAVIVDESVIQKGLDGVDGLPVDLNLDALTDGVFIANDQPGHATQRLRHVHRITRAALDQMPDGPLNRQALLDLGLTFETGTDGQVHTWRRLVDPGLYPGMPAKQRRQMVEDIQENRLVKRTAWFFKALAELLKDGGPVASGWASLVTKDTPDGPQRVIRLRGRRSVTKGWLAPTLLIDALLAPDLARFYWPGLEMVADIEAQAPNMRIRQMTGRDWVKSALVPDEHQTPKENERRLKNSERLRAAVMREAFATSGKVLVVTQKAVRQHWETCGHTPENVDYAHHNAVAGIDRWGGVERLVVVGRTLPRPGDVERLAEALTGAAVAQRAIRYERRDGAIQLADGSSVTAEADFHPDPVAEAIRWQICEGELIQIIGRGRGSSRSATNPLEVLVLTDRPLPLEIHEAVTWESLMPSPIDLMLSREGVAVLSPTDAAHCFPDLWGSPAAAKMAFNRDHRVTNPFKEYLYKGNVTLCLSATYQKAGERQRPAKVIFDPSKATDLHGWLEDRIGELARLKLDEPPPEPDPEPTQPGVEGDDLETAHTPHAPGPGGRDDRLRFKRSVTPEAGCGSDPPQISLAAKGRSVSKPTGLEPVT